jgi:hypothetical protein
MIVVLAAGIRKIKLHRAGRCIGSIYRWHGRTCWRGIVKKEAGDLAEIIYRDGRIEKVKQR